MVRGETYDKQLFESEAFRHFINIFLNKQSGVTKGCELSKKLQSIVVGTGSFVIQGGFLKEVTGTENEIPSEAGYYKLVYEIDLSKTNTKDKFKQGSYKFVKALGDYPQLIQEDLDNSGNIYQLPFCQFKITETGLQDFKDLREFIEYRIYQKNVEEAINEAIKTNIIIGEECETNEYEDGKRVYIKKFIFEALPNKESSIAVDTGLNFSEIFIRRMEGIARNRETGSSFPINYANPSAAAEMIGLRCVGNSQLRIYVGTDRSAYDAYVKLYYTKN